METQLVDMTPELAAAILEENNKKNFRKLDPKRIVKYATAMKLGKWEQNGETIKINTEDILLDGQHRLAAIVKSGCTVPMLIVYGIQASAKNIDRGKPRFVSDYLAHAGLKNTKNMATASRYILLHRMKMWNSTDTSPPQLLDDMQIDLLTGPEGDRITDAMSLCAKVPVGFSKASLCAVLYLGTPPDVFPSNHPTVKAFADAIRTGAGMNNKQAVYHLREQILKSVMSDRTPRYTPHQTRMLISTAWNRTVLGKPVGRLQMQQPDKILVAKPVATMFDSLDDLPVVNSAGHTGELLKKHTKKGKK